jgi:hypothetical protein
VLALGNNPLAPQYLCILTLLDNHCLALLALLETRPLSQKQRVEETVAQVLA